MRYFAVSSVFHYLGPSFAVLLFARVDVLGVAWMRITTAALVFALWRRPWTRLRERDVLLWGLVLAAMNCCFYQAISRLPLGTVAAIEFVPVVVLAALGARTPRAAAALALAVGGVALLADVRLQGAPLGFALAAANAGLFATYIVLADRVSGAGGLDALAAAMVVAAVFVAPTAGVPDLTALAAGRGRDLLQRDPLRHGPARAGAHAARDVRAADEPAAGAGHRDRPGRARPGADPPRGGRGPAGGGRRPAQPWISQPSAARAASITPSANVGCRWTIRATSG